MTNDLTALDHAYQAMATATDDETRLQFYERLADGEMFLLLQDDADGTTLTPRIFDLEDGPVVLVFDREDRMTAFTGGISPYAALPGRVVAQQLAGQGIGLGINLGPAPSAMLLPPDAVDWLAETLGNAPQETAALPDRFDPPKGLPERLVQALDAKLARAAGLADHALLAAVTYRDGRRGHMLAIVGAAAGAQPALARAVSEALTFSGVAAGELDVTFMDASAPAMAAIARVALRFTLPSPPANAPTAPKAPGSDPDRPPILR